MQRESTFGHGASFDGSTLGGFAGLLYRLLRVVRFGALALVVALSPSTYGPTVRSAAARQICLGTLPVLAGFTLLVALLGLVLIRIVVVTADSYGLSQYALEMVVRVLVIELIPLAAALFVTLRSGVAMSAEVAAMHIRDDLGALRRSGVERLRVELVPRIVAAAFAVVLLAALSCAITLVLAYLAVYGFSPWGLDAFAHTVGRIFEPLVGFGFGLKVMLFSLAVGVVPIAASLEAAGAGDGASGRETARRGMAGVLATLILIEGASLALRYA